VITSTFLFAAVLGPGFAIDNNARDARGRTPLMVATLENDLFKVKELIEAGADINLQDDLQDNPFLYAGAEGLTEILELLIAAKPDLKLLNRYGGTALIPAAHHGHVENVRMLLTQTKIDVNHVNNLGWTALLEAVILGNGGKAYQQIVRLLLDHGADVNRADSAKVSPLQHARQRGFVEIETLLEAAGGR